MSNCSQAALKVLPEVVATSPCAYSKLVLVQTLKKVRHLKFSNKKDNYALK